jgi:DNA-directed RNA polymerase specialized sigma24 family protein
METGKPSPPLDVCAALMKDEERARRMVRTWGFCSADADDITQEVLIVLAARRATFRAPEGGNVAEAWSAFVWGVVVRQVASFRREQARLRRGDERAAEEPAPIAPSMEEVVIAEAPRALFRRAVAALAPPLSAVMDLHLADLPMPAAAARLDIPAGTAWTRFRAACAEVRATVRRWNVEQRGARWS